MKSIAQLACLGVLFCYSGVAGVIFIEPPSAMTTLGGTISIGVNVTGISDLYAFQFDIGFNPAVLSAASVTEGALFSSVGLFFSSGVIDNAAGSIAFIGDTVAGAGPGVSGSGTLAHITFDAIGAGWSNIDISNIVLLDSFLGDINADATGAVAEVVPEPATGVLLAVALGSLGVVRLRRRSRAR